LSFTILNKTKIINLPIFYLICFISVVLPLIYSDIFKDSFIDTKNLFLQVTITVLIVLFIFNQIITDKKNEIRKADLFYPLLILGIFSFIFLYKSLNPLVSLEAIYRQFSYIVIYFIIISIGLTLRRIYYLLNVIFLSAFAVIVFRYIIFFSIFENFSFLSKNLIEDGSTLGNPNFLGYYLVQIIPIGIFLIVKTKNQILKSFYSLAIIFIFFHFIKIRSVGAWSSLLISLIIISFLILIKNKEEIKQKLSRKFAAKLLIITVFVLFILVPIFYTINDDILALINSNFTKIEINKLISDNFKIIKDESYDTINLDSRGNISSLYRLLLWKSSLNIIKDHPVVGRGLNCFQFTLPFYWKKEMLELSEFNSLVLTKRAHNEYLQLWIELGLFGLIIFLFIMFIFIKRFIRVVYSEFKNRSLVLFLAVSILSILIYSFFSFPLQLPVGAFTFWLIWGLFEVISKDNNRLYEDNNFNYDTNKVEYRLISPKRVLVILLTLGFVFISGIFNYRFVRANIHFKRGITSLNSNIDVSENEFRLASKYIPYDYESYFYLGKIYLEKGQLDKAITNFQKSIQLSKFHLSHYNLAIAYYLQGQKEEAITEFENSIKTYPLNAEAYTYLGIIYSNYLETYDSKKAIKNFHEALMIDDKYYQAHQGLGKLYFDSYEYSKAKEEFLKVLDIKKNDLLSLRCLAEIFEKEDDLLNSLRYYNLYYEQKLSRQKKSEISKKIEEIRKKLNKKSDF